jgi:hypothetical protein
MKTVQVKPVGGGWIVDNDAALATLAFSVGAEAERSARRLAQLLAEERTDQAQVVVHDLRGVIVGSVVYGPGR